MVKQVTPLTPIETKIVKKKKPFIKQVKALEHKPIVYKTVYEPISPKVPKRPEDRRARAIVKLVSLVFVIIGSIFFVVMIDTFVEFGAFVKELKAEVQMYYGYYWEQIWKSPEVQSAISEGYMMLFIDKAIFFVPLFIVAIVVYVKGNQAIEKRALKLKPKY